MRKTSSFLVLFLCLGLVAHAANFTASLDRDSISLGESATLSLIFEGGQPQNAPTPNVPGLEIVSAGNSQNISSLNGQMNSTVTVTYSITPQRTGAFVFPAMTAEIDGHQLSSQPLRLSVLKADEPSATAVNSGSEMAFMKLSLPKQSIYAGQILTAQLQICLRDDARNFGNFQFTSQPADGFTVGKMAQGQNQSAQIGNRGYTVIPLSFALTAVKSGTLSLGPFTASATYVVPSDNQGSDTFFGQIFNQGEQKQVALATGTLEMKSLPLPAKNVPADFNGAVGDFTMTVTAGPTNLAVGDPITIRVQISGRGAVDAIMLSNQTAWGGFKIFPPSSKVATIGQLGLEGSKTFEEIVMPQNADARALPAFSFSFFNPDDGQYHTLTQPPVPLAVHSGGAAVMPAMAVTKNFGAENQTPQDILPIMENLGTLGTKGAPFVAQPAFLAVQSLPVLAFLAAFIWRKRTDRLANNPRLRRQRAVTQLVRDGLNNLRQLAAENKPDEFFATLFRLLQEALGERLDCPASAITENVIDDYPILRAAPKATLDGLRELFQLCNQARYASVHGTSELNMVAAKFAKADGELQEVKI